MTPEALAHGPWALFNSADLMRSVLTDVNDAFNTFRNQDHTSQLYGQYFVRQSKPTHNRPLPLPDALLQGAEQLHSLKCSEDDDVSMSWLEDVIKSPWLWKLQWATLTILLIAPSFRTLLASASPKCVADKWLADYESRIYCKLLGRNVAEGDKSAVAAMTPLMTVVSEMILLRMSYDH